MSIIKRIDQLKQYITNEINSLSIEDFETLLDILKESNLEFISKDNLFPCKSCESHYGACNWEENQGASCHARFQSYMNEPVEQQEDA